MYPEIYNCIQEKMVVYTLKNLVYKIELKIVKRLERSRWALYL